MVIGVVLDPLEKAHGLDWEDHPPGTKVWELPKAPLIPKASMESSLMLMATKQRFL